MRIQARLSWSSIGILVLFMGAAQGGDLGRDKGGAADIPAIPRFESAVIIGHRASPFEETLIPAGPWENGSGAGAWKESLKVAGRRTRLLYLAPANASPNEVILHYRQTLERHEYEPLYQCSGFEACGVGVERFYSEESHGKKLTDTHLLKHVFSETSVQEPRLLTARRPTPEGESHVFVFAAHQDNFADSEAGDRVAIFVEEVFSRPIADPMVLVAAEEMAKGIDESGRIAIHGLRFEAGEATLGPESRPQLDEMARMLGEQPDLSLYIVAHTDNQGTLEDNMDLSRRRAEEVVRTLIQSYGVLGERLGPMGVASLAPMAANTTEAGRALNRRVELVAR